MPDLEQRMRGIDHLPVPDLWERARVESIDHYPVAQPPAVRRVVVVAAALAISAAALWFVWTSLRSGTHDRPATPSISTRPATPPISTRNGDIWVRVSSEDWRDVAIYRVDPQHVSRPKALWTDSPEVFTDARLAPALMASDFEFSPDGAQVVFSASVEPGTWRRPRELFVMNADGTGLRQLTHDGRYSTAPAWSPDGNTIAYTSTDKALNPTDIYTVGARGGTSAPLAADPSVSEKDPSWSPDGAMIAFTVVDINGVDKIISMRPDGTDRVELARSRVSRPEWSPDGSSIAFFRKEDATLRIWTVAPDGSGARQLVDTGTKWSLGGPFWSPDGNSIAFARSSGGTTSLWLIDAAGTSPPERVAGWPGFNGFPIAWRPVPDPGVSTIDPPS